MKAPKVIAEFRFTDYKLQLVEHEPNKFVIFKLDNNGLLVIGQYLWTKDILVHIIEYICFLKDQMVQDDQLSKMVFERINLLDISEGHIKNQYVSKEGKERADKLVSLLEKVSY